MELGRMATVELKKYCTSFYMQRSQTPPFPWSHLYVCINPWCSVKNISPSLWISKLILMLRQSRVAKQPVQQVKFKDSDLSAALANSVSYHSGCIGLD